MFSMPELGDNEKPPARGSLEPDIKRDAQEIRDKQLEAQGLSKAEKPVGTQGLSEHAKEIYHEIHQRGQHDGSWFVHSDRWAHRGPTQHAKTKRAADSLLKRGLVRINEHTEGKPGVWTIEKRHNEG
jgi:hypothetical protein